MFIKFIKGMGEWRLRKTRSGQPLGRVIPVMDWKYEFRTVPRDETVPEVPSGEKREDVISAANRYLNDRAGLCIDHYEKQK